MGVIAEGILRGYQGLFTPVSLGFLSVFNKNSTLKGTRLEALNLASKLLPVQPSKVGGRRHHDS